MVRVLVMPAVQRAPPLFCPGVLSMLALVLMLVTSVGTPPSLTSMLPAARSRKGEFPASLFPGFPRDFLLASY